MTSEGNHPFFGREGFDRLHGIINDIAKQGIGLHRGKKFQPCAIRHAGKGNTVFLTGHGFFAQNHIQHLVARFDVGVVELDGLPQGSDLLAGELILNFI